MKNISLKGFFLSVHCPSEDQLSVSIDCSRLNPRAFIQLIYDLQDTLSMIDEEYAKRRIVGRSLRGRHRKIFDERRRALKFSPLPSYFSNRIRYVRTRLYNYINSNAIVIQEMSRGFYRRNIYLLPQDKADTFLQFVSVLNNEIDELNKEIAYFDLSEIISILDRYGLELPKEHFYISDIEVDLTPIQLDYTLIERWAEQSPRVAEILKEKQKQLIVKTIDDLRRKLDPIIKSILAEKKLRNARKKLNEIRKIAEEIGIKSIADTIITPIIEQIENPSKYINIEKEVDGRIKSLIQSL